jgi:hypothetical protein
VVATGIKRTQMAFTLYLAFFATSRLCVNSFDLEVFQQAAKERMRNC